MPVVALADVLALELVAVVVLVFLASGVVAASVPLRWAPVLPLLSVAGSALWWYLTTAHDRATYQGGDCNACIAALPATALCFVSLAGIVSGALVRRRRHSNYRNQ